MFFLVFRMDDGSDWVVSRLRRNLKPGQFILGEDVVCGSPPQAPVDLWRVDGIGFEGTSDYVVNLSR